MVIYQLKCLPYSPAVSFKCHCISPLSYYFDGSMFSSIRKIC